MTNTVENYVKEDARIIRTKRDLANALEELLQERNFDELSVKDITDKAMISKNTFYNNFQDKNELLNFLFMRYKDELMKKIQPYLDHYVHALRKIFFRTCLEKVVHAFYESNLPIDKMILADKSKCLYWNITKFVKEVLEDLDRTYDHFLTSHADPKITSYFFAGAFASTLYFSILEDDKVTEEKIFKSLLKLAAPVAE